MTTVPEASGRRPDGYYGLDGEPLTAGEWGEIFVNLAAKTIAKTGLTKPNGEDVEVLTVWEGVVLPDKPWTFYTACRHGTAIDWVTVGQYKTKELALEGHGKIVQELLRGPES